MAEQGRIRDGAQFYQPNSVIPAGGVQRRRAGTQGRKHHPFAAGSRIALRASGMTVGAYGPAEFQAALGVSRETMERLVTHQRLLAEWSERMNLVGPKELEAFWSRHALDSAQLIQLAPEAKSWVDLGSGAGFPGLVVSAFLAERPGTSMHLVEATGKKAAFLRAVAEEAGLPVTVFNERIEAFGAGHGPYDVVTARALAPLNRLIPYAKPILDRGAQGLFHKGADLDAELAAAKDVLNGGAYRADVLESLSDPRGRIIRVTKAA